MEFVCLPLLYSTELSVSFIDHEFVGRVPGSSPTTHRLSLTLVE